MPIVPHNRPTKAHLHEVENMILGRIEAVTSAEVYRYLDHVALDNLITDYRFWLKEYQAWAKGKSPRAQYQMPKKVSDAINKYQNP